MKTTYLIVAAIVLIVVIVGSIFAYTQLSSPSASTNPSPSPSPTTTVAPTSTPVASTTSPTLTPTTVNGAGGSLVYPLMSEWITAGYPAVQPNIKVAYTPVGSGTGIADFQSQVVDFGESDAPMTAAQYSALPSGTTALTIPISASAVVPAYNLKLVNGSMCQNGLNFTGAVLADIFLGTINKWNDPAITALQSPSVAAQLPGKTIITVHRSDGSGTMFAFTDYLSQASNQWKTQVGQSTSVNWPNPGGIAIGARLNAGVAGAIASNVYSIGPLEVAYEIQNAGQISYGAVQNAAGNFVLANVTNIGLSLQAGATSLPAGDAHWSSVSIVDAIFNDTTATGAYPIATLTYALVYEQQTSQVQGAAVVDFLSWVVNNGQTFGPALGYVPLPANIVAINNATLKLVTYNGTPFIS